MTRAMSELLAPEDGRSVWKIRFKPPGYRKAVKLSTRAKNKANADRFRVRVDCLIDDRANGDPPRPELSPWIESLHPDTADRLIDLGLLSRARFEQAKTLLPEPDGATPPDRERWMGHVADWQKAVNARRNNTADYARAVARYVRRIVREVKADYYPQLNRHDVEVKVAEWALAPNTRRKYLQAIADFSAWMKADKRTSIDLFADLHIPTQLKEGEVRRRGLSVEEFQELVAYLDAFQADEKLAGCYDDQRAGWDARDRKMIYWTAVSTGYRQGELRSLRRYQLYLGDDPAMIDIHAADAKNRTAGSVPIPTNLAEELQGYVAMLHTEARVFPIPAWRRRVMEFFRKDLAGARARWCSAENLDDKEKKRRAGSSFLRDEHGSGRLDFHSLRHTAITWWLDVYNLSPKRVQILARLKTLALVENYSRALRTVNNFDYLAKAPQLAAPAKPKEQVA